MFRKISLLLSGNMLRTALMFIRTIIIARLISLEDFGIAATFTTAVAIIQLGADLGLNKLIIQDSRGDDPEFQAALQGFQLLRSIISALLVVLLAHPIAVFLGHEELTWAYQLMALVPFFNGLMNLDIQRQQRRMNFIPMIVRTNVTPLLTLALIWPLYTWFNDFRMMLGVLIAQAFLGCAITHVMSERRFRVRFDRSVMAHGLNFGWPMLLDSLLLFTVFHGEKLIVGRELGLATLAIFSMGLSLVQSPSGALTTSLTQFLMPQVSAAKEDDRIYNRMALVTLQGYYLAMMVMCLGVLILREPVINIALGEKYVPVIHFLIWFIIMQSLRTAKNGTALISLARARTGNGLMGNLPRVASVLLSWYMMTLGYELPMVLGIAILGELAGFLLTVWLMGARAGVLLAPLLPSLLAFLGFLVVLGICGLAQAGVWGARIPPLTFDLVPVAAFMLTMLTMRPLVRYIRRREMVMYQ